MTNAEHQLIFREIFINNLRDFRYQIKIDIESDFQSKNIVKEYPPSYAKI
jgi:hypothetical protein